MDPSWRKHSLIAAALLTLAGCSPTYNWRETRLAEQGVAVMLPGKPTSMTQRIRLSDLDLVMTMTGALVDDMPFTVACATLPDDQAATRERVLEAMRAGMLRNIAAGEPRTEPVTLRHVDAQGKTIADSQGVRVAASGAAQGRPMRMVAVFAGHAKRACQAVALGGALPEEEARIFVDSFRFIEPVAGRP